MGLFTVFIADDVFWRVVDSLTLAPDSLQNGSQWSAKGGNGGNERITLYLETEANVAIGEDDDGLFAEFLL